MASHDQTPTMHRGSTSPVHDLTNTTSADAPQYSYNPPDRSHYDNYMRTGVPKEDPVPRASSNDPTTKESHPPPVPPKDGLYQRLALIQQTRIEDYKSSSSIPIDAEEDGPAPRENEPVVRESLSSEPDLSNKETRRPRAASFEELGAPRPSPRSPSTPALRRRRTSRERDDGGCRLTSPPPGLLRPTTFWRNIPRSAVAKPDFSPVIRRSTFIAAGIPVDGPLSGLSALGVETRENDYIRRPIYTLSRIFLLLGGFLVIGVAPTVAHASPQQVGIDPTQTTSSFNWWPYPSWGASSLSAPVLMTAISTTLATTPSTVASVSTDPVISSSLSSGTPSLAGSVTTEENTGTSGRVGTTVQITALSPSAPIPSHDVPTSSPRPATFKPIYLLPVTIFGGAILGACATAFIYSRWYSISKPLPGDDSTSAGFPARKGYHGVEEWEGEENERGGEEKHFIAQSDDSGDDFRAGSERSSNDRPRGYNSNHSSAAIAVPAVARHFTQYSSQYPELDISKAKSGFSRARTTRTRRTEYDDIDSWYARKDHIEEDSIAGLSDEEPPSPYARLSDFRKPRATTSGFVGQGIPDYEHDDPERSLLPTSVDRLGVFRRRVTPIHMRGHGRSDSNAITQDVLRVPGRPLEGKLLPPSPASVYPEDEGPSIQKLTPPLPHSSSNPSPWPSGYRRSENLHPRVVSPPPLQLASSNLSFSNPPRFSIVRNGDYMGLNLALEDERGPRVAPKRSEVVNKDFATSDSASPTFINPPSRFSREPELDSRQAFSKVNDILRRSWDQRDLDDRPSSPTGFGAIIDNRVEMQRPLYGARPMRSGDGTGQAQVNFGTVRGENESIEQRLANLRRKDNRFDRM